MSFLKYQSESPEIINNYLKYRAYVEFKSKTTADSTYFDLRTLFRYLKLYLYDKDKLDTITPDEFREVSITDITADNLNEVTYMDLQNYVMFLATILQNDAKTRNRKVSTTKMFFRYLCDNRYIDSNPAQFLESARAPKRLTKELSLEESKKLLATTIRNSIDSSKNDDTKNNSNNNGNSKDNSNKTNCKKNLKITDETIIRNYAIICLFLNTGIRLSELVNINLTDFKFEESERTLKIRGKGDKDRIVYLDDAVLEAIYKYLQVRPKLTKENIDYNALFISRQNKRISNREVQVIIKDEINKLFADDPDVAKKYHTHSLRHTSATLLYNDASVDILIIKKILGHESLAATEVYTHVSNKKLKEIMMNFSVQDLIAQKVNQNQD